MSYVSYLTMLKISFQNNFSPNFIFAKISEFHTFSKPKKKPKIGTGPRVSLLNLLVYLVDYHFQLFVVPHLFEAAKYLRLKIKHSLKN